MGVLVPSQDDYATLDKPTEGYGRKWSGKEEHVS